MGLRNREVRTLDGPSMQMLISPRMTVYSGVWNATVSQVSRSPGRGKNDEVRQLGGVSNEEGSRW